MSKIVPKKVEMIELFYDLIFVYAVAKMTAIIHHLHDGHVSLVQYLQFVAVTLMVLQLWIYQTNFVNRYGKSTLFENIMLMMNMCATIYMANSINTDWSVTFKAFNVSFVFMILPVIFQFLSHLKPSPESRKEIFSFIVPLTVELLLVVMGLCVGYQNGGLYFVIGGYIVGGVILPLFLTRKHLDADRTNFPHLVERMGLITIITFGETIINIADYFEISSFSLPAVLVFSSVALLFASYVMQMDKFLDHHQSTKGLYLIYSHFGVMIGLGSITVAWSFLHANDVDRTFLVGFILLGYAIFYLSLFVNSVYNKAQYRLCKQDVGAYLATFVATAIALLLAKNNNYFLIVIILIGNLLFSGYSYRKLKRK